MSQKRIEEQRQVRAVYCLFRLLSKFKLLKGTVSGIRVEINGSMYNLDF